MLRVLICDDSKISLDINKVYIEEFTRKRNVQAEISAFSEINEELEQLIQKQKIDIAVLDIDFHNKKEGIRLGKKTLQYQPYAAVIFVTNYVEYAMEAFEIIPFGFLQKPIIEDKFERLFVRALIQLNGLVATKNNSSIEVVANGMHQILKENSIFFIEKVGHVAQINTKTGVYGVYDSLKSLEEKLSPCFIKINKGILVNMNHVMQVTNKMVKLRNGNELPISQRKTRYVQETVNDFLSGFH